VVTGFSHGSCLLRLHSHAALRMRRPGASVGRVEQLVVVRLLTRASALAPEHTFAAYVARCSGASENSKPSDGDDDFSLRVSLREITDRVGRVA
jgi:hypothetical protein